MGLTSTHADFASLGRPCMHVQHCAESMELALSGLEARGLDGPCANCTGTIGLARITSLPTPSSSFHPAHNSLLLMFRFTHI